MQSDARFTLCTEGQSIKVMRKDFHLKEAVVVRVGLKSYTEPTQGDTKTPIVRRVKTKLNTKGETSTDKSLCSSFGETVDPPPTYTDLVRDVGGDGHAYLVNAFRINFSEHRHEQRALRRAHGPHDPHQLPGLDP